FRVVDVDPIVGEKMRLVYDANNSEKIPISKPRGGIDDGFCGRLKPTNEVRHRHARDKARSLYSLFTPAVSANDAVDMSSGPIDPDHLGFHSDAPGPALNFALYRVPHHPGPIARIIELFDERLDRSS